MKLFAYFANPDRFLKTSKYLMPIFGLLAIFCLVSGNIWAVKYAPSHIDQSIEVKIIYIHLPATLMALAIYIFMTIGSFSGYVWRHQLADLSARHAAPLGAGFTALALITGVIWGAPIWGTWWQWNTRMTSLLILLFIYIGYITLSRAMESTHQTTKFTALLCMMGAINIPIIQFAVNFWNTLHQPSSIIRPNSPPMPSAIPIPTMIILLGFVFLFGFLFIINVRRHIASEQNDLINM